ncbi:MAG: c-type cytochrome domain-containing protein, partial [Planctomycetota bacterium]
MKILLTLPLLFFGLTFIEPLQVSAEEQIDFNRDIRPILADKCFQCHGPDEADRAADLRLDEEASAQDFAFVPGDVENSEGWLRIISTD